MKITPDANQQKNIKSDLDRFCGIGVVALLVLLAFPYVGMGMFKENTWIAVGGIIVVSFILFLFVSTLEKKIVNRKIWWFIGASSWIATFGLAMSGYYMR